MPERHGRPDVLTRNDLHAIADRWPALVDRLGGAGGGTANDGMPRSPSAERWLPIDEGVSELIGELTAWAHFLARLLADEVTGQYVRIPFRPVDVPWRPADPTMPGLLRCIAGQAAHLTGHPDEQLRLAVTTEAVEWRQRVERMTGTGQPVGRRPATNTTEHAAQLKTARSRAGVHALAVALRR